MLLTATLGFAPLAESQSVSGKDVLAPTAYASFDPVARGMDLNVAVVLKIKPGFHRFRPICGPMCQPVSN